jgi:hypothetical protein
MKSTNRVAQSPYRNREVGTYDPNCRCHLTIDKFGIVYVNGRTDREILRDFQKACRILDSKKEEPE